MQQANVSTLLSSTNAYAVPFAEFQRAGAIKRGETPTLRYVTLVHASPTDTQHQVDANGAMNRIAMVDGIVHWTDAVRGTPLENVTIHTTRIFKMGIDENAAYDAQGRLSFELTSSTARRIAHVLYLFGLTTEARAAMHAKWVSLEFEKQCAVEIRTEQELQFAQLLNQLDTKTVQRLQRDHKQVKKAVKPLAKELAGVITELAKTEVPAQQ
jgi:hypothetical protein